MPSWGHGEGPVRPRVVDGCVPGSVDWVHGEGPVCPRVVDWWVCTW